jgi:hypothetical protein
MTRHEKRKPNRQPEPKILPPLDPVQGYGLDASRMAFCRKQGFILGLASIAFHAHSMILIPKAG